MNYFGHSQSGTKSDKYKKTHNIKDIKAIETILK